MRSESEKSASFRPEREEAGDAGGDEIEVAGDQPVIQHAAAGGSEEGDVRLRAAARGVLLDQAFMLEHGEG